MIEHHAGVGALGDGARFVEVFEKMPHLRDAVVEVSILGTLIGGEIPGGVPARVRA